MKFLTVIFMIIAIYSPQSQGGDRFYQGPGGVGSTQDLSGVVIGDHSTQEINCYVVLADKKEPNWAGLGGGGRFFLCQKILILNMNQIWSGRAKQIGTRQARVGPSWMVLPIFTPIYSHRP